MEPESAAIHCQYKAGKGSEHFIVIDIGGGTVDIASHATLARNFCSGTTVNERFSEFLQGFVDDLKFSHYIQSGAPEEKNTTQSRSERISLQ